MFRLILSFCITALALASVEAQRLDKNHAFRDGLYLRFESFQADSPDISWDEVHAVVLTNPLTAITSLDSLRWRHNGQPISIDSVWGFSIDGLPSVRIPPDQINKQLPAFAALKVRGRICYFTYPDYRWREIAVAAYNPVTGRPFRTGKVRREKEVLVERMLHFETGEIADFTVENFLQWIQDDPMLYKTLVELPPAEQREKLYKSLLIYDDRHPTHVGRR